MSKSLRDTEAAVLANYKKENPSVHFLAESDSAFRERLSKREILFRDNLKFPPKMFAGCDLLDLGAGTGENTVYYALWGARCTLVEINDEASARAGQIFERYASGPVAHEFICSSLFDFESDRRFDIVLSEGVIHHTADKQQGFAKLASFLKPDGYVVLGVGNAAGCFQRALQRVILFRFADDEGEIVAVAERLFKEHIDRAARYGQRSRRAIIFDSFVNPKVDFPSVAEVLHWFAEAGLRLYSTWPPILPPALGDSGMRSTFEPLALPEIGAAAEAVWLAHDRDDADELAERLGGLAELDAAQSQMTRYVNDFQPAQAFSAQDLQQMTARYRAALDAYQPFAGFTRKLGSLLSEIEGAIGMLDKGDLEGLKTRLDSAAHLFRGTGGLGVTRYVGYKPQTD